MVFDDPWNDDSRSGLHSLFVDGDRNWGKFSQEDVFGCGITTNRDVRGTNDVLVSSGSFELQ